MYSEMIFWSQNGPTKTLTMSIPSVDPFMCRPFQAWHLTIFVLCSKPQLLQGVYGMGFNRPSKIQETALPMMLAEPWVHLLWSPLAKHYVFKGSLKSLNLNSFYIILKLI